MTAPRDYNLQTWIYRATSSLDHSEFVPYGKTTTPEPKTNSPNSYMWPVFPLPSGADWTDQILFAKNGDAGAKTGLAIWVFSVTESMKDNTAFSSLDGDCLIVPHQGCLDIQTELGKLLVRQNEICVIPRGIRYRVTLPAGPCRGWICELYQGHFRLPDLGVIGSTGLANIRDFQIPSAHFDGSLQDNIAVANDTDYTIISRQEGRLWQCTQDHTPFDVAAWHGTSYPYKYDLARFCVMGNMLFDEHDPSLYVVLTAPSNREPGSAVVDFAIIPPRWAVAEDTFWLPYYHRNTMSEFFGPIVNSQDPKHPFNQGEGFKPFAAGLHPPMTTHGPTEDDFQKNSKSENKPAKLMNDGLTVFLFETERPLYLSEWAVKDAKPLINFNAAAAKKKKASKI
jgi:homogentisate 1,2-dioxygenase